MKIGILSFKSLSRKTAKEELRLQKEARAQGHTCRILRSRKFQMVYDQGTPWLLYGGKPFGKYDVIIARPTILNNVDLHVALVKQMELSGVLIFNRHQAILDSKNKVRSMQILDHYGIPIPKTVVVANPDDLKQAAELVGKFPLILKTPCGSFGNGVTIVESMRALKSTIQWHEPMYFLQQYVKFSKGKDIRVFVINGEVIGAMMRSAVKGEFRSNIELGGKGQSVEITEEEARIAIRAVQALDLNYGGVDIIRSKKGPLVLEVNSNPGFKGLEAAAGLNVAAELVKYAVELAQRHKSHMV